MGFLGGSVGKNQPANIGDTGDTGSIPGSGRSPGRGKWQSIPVLLAGKCQGKRNQVGYGPWSHKELDMTEWLSMHICTYTHILHYAV